MLGTVIALVLLFACIGDLPRLLAPQSEAAQVSLSDGWQLASAEDIAATGSQISRGGFAGAGWHTVRHMPATVLQALQDDGTYPDLYFGDNLVTKVPPDLYKQDWWYRTSFVAPAGHSTYRLDFPGINYRAEIWLNGHQVAGNEQVAGMYVDHDLDVSRWVDRGHANTLAVKITPERALQDIDGVELADSWFDWINWNYLGYQGPGKNPANGNSFVPDRNAGILKPVVLKMSGDVAITGAAVDSELPLPRTDSARLTIRTGVSNHSGKPVAGVVHASITRSGKQTVEVERPVTLKSGENRDITFSPKDFEELRVNHPDLWWPYNMGKPELYDLTIEFRQLGQATDQLHQKFGIRSIEQGRDGNDQFPQLGTGGNFYLKVNGRDMLIRGATYTPDLLYRDDPDRENAILHYVKDLGLNMIRMESKIPGERFAARADELGIPLMVGWMCCNQWEKWPQWSDEDQRIAQESLRSQILMLRSHASAFIWANASDGHPPADILAEYHRILKDLHWPNAIVDTVSSYATDGAGDRIWDGIQMAGPYTWRPPTYWFSGRYAAARGASAEQGDNEHIPPFATLRKFIPPDKLWPIDDAWYFHAGSNPGNAALASTRNAIVQRYGSSTGAEEFARKAQLAHYESTRAQFESFAALDQSDRRMTIYWMLNSHWPSFFGNIFDYYLRPGGAYYGAKKGLQPLSVTFDSYATGDHGTANITITNQSPNKLTGARARTRIYDLTGKVRDDRTSEAFNADPGTATVALTLPREAPDSRVFFVRCELLDSSGAVLADNNYWQSQQNDDVGDPKADVAFELHQSSWADMTALNSMPKATLEVTATGSVDSDRQNVVDIALSNPTRQVAFFERAELVPDPDADEILPIQYSDNYVTVYPGETVHVKAVVPTPGVTAGWVRVGGYNTAPVTVPVGPAHPAGPASVGTPVDAANAKVADVAPGGRGTEPGAR
ncbi:glycoside hydrolase [Mycobacterium sp. OTB74]|uniref:glycoside hydrolase family 2 protein n=1 Tax=Mycobacterium sp. OTB74 TaxID=1853452 RepID=UPI0024753F48|nr:glycoside hydrolase [Mycobacterium sp. OTB74]MDH6247330.1 exo-1,4-beta-D-glucosaminidase [Mycobacterium sp. OTB74]